MLDTKFEIIEHIAVLSSSRCGWIREINRVSWNGNEARYDIRDWSPDHKKMSSGLTLSDEEYNSFKNCVLA